ncbi:MAG: DNA-binding response regulator [Haliscomenobacteraceae bacterium CHB4]|nr:Transcriptional regulatory protein OmpR [Saprospiraceae bacterium]MCE7923839.1 DNA-binding response regulator [Haliscomenobacteraceae bacterium CHB4]
MNNASKILLVEDDLSLGFLLSEYLESEGFEVKLCRDGESGLAAFQRGHFDLCILDVMMPRMDGFTCAGHLKAHDTDVPFLFLSARSLKDDKLRGFALGADDYMTKPFDEEELLCRIKVLLRRRAENTAEKTQPAPQHFTIGSYCFDCSRQELRRENEAWRLTETEAEVLRLLCLHQNQILRRDDAVEKIYGKRDYFLGRSFDVFISKLRKLLQHDERISIENVFRVGFILNVRDV